MISMLVVKISPLALVVYMPTNYITEIYLLEILYYTTLDLCTLLLLVLVSNALPCHRQEVFGSLITITLYVISLVQQQILLEVSSFFVVLYEKNN